MTEHQIRVMIRQLEERSAFNLTHANELKALLTGDGAVSAASSASDGKRKKKEKRDPNKPKKSMTSCKSPLRGRMAAPPSSRAYRARALRPFLLTASLFSRSRSLSSQFGPSRVPCRPSRLHQ